MNEWTRVLLASIASRTEGETDSPELEELWVGLPLWMLEGDSDKGNK